MVPNIYWTRFLQQTLFAISNWYLHSIDNWLIVFCNLHVNLGTLQEVFQDRSTQISSGSDLQAVGDPRAFAFWSPAPAAKAAKAEPWKAAFGWDGFRSTETGKTWKNISIQRPKQQMSQRGWTMHLLIWFEICIFFWMRISGSWFGVSMWCLSATFLVSACLPEAVCWRPYLAILSYNLARIHLTILAS